MGLKRHSELAAHAADVRPRAYGRDFLGLCEQLGDAEATVRRWAARDLAREPLAAAVLCARLDGETDDRVRAAIFTSLAQIGRLPEGSALVVASALPWLRSDDAVLRNGAIELLAGMPDAVGPHVEALLLDPDVDVRILCVNLLGQLPHASVPGWLAAVLARDQAVNVVAAALEVVAEVGGCESRPAVERARGRFADDPFIGFAADLALERIGAA